MAREQELLERLARNLGALAVRKVLPKIGSRTLRDALELIVEPSASGFEARLLIPHYWAVYYHDGRAGFGVRDANFLVFFNNPKDDPRLSGGLPVRQSDVRTLTRAEFEEGLGRNRDRFARGEDPFMFVVSRVGPAVPHRFFETGMVGFATEITAEASRLVDDFIQSMVDEVGSDEGVAGFSIG